MVRDLVTKPLNSGKEEIETAPIMQKIIVSGMRFHNPPNSLALAVPVRYSTAPMLINNSAL